MNEPEPRGLPPVGRLRTKELIQAKPRSLNFHTAGSPCTLVEQITATGRSNSLTAKVMEERTMSHLAKSIDTVTADLVEAQPVIQPGGAVTWVAFQRGGRRATSDDFNTATALTAGLVAAACLTVRAISLPNWLTDWPKALRGRLNLVSASSANRIHLRLRIRNEGRGPNLISDFTAAMNDEWSGPEITYPTPSGLLRQLLGLMSGDRVGELLAPLAARLASDEVETSIGLLDRESVDGIRSLIPERLPIPFPV